MASYINLYIKWLQNSSLSFLLVTLCCQTKESVKVRGDNKLSLRFFNFSN